MKAETPNVVLIVLDSVRRAHLSCYGYARPTTPRIDRIAAEGIRFTRAWAASCWTLPSHASLFTGLYPSEHLADVDTWRLGPDRPTLAEYLRGKGYATASISCNGIVSEHTGLTRGFEVRVDVEALAGARTGLVPRAIRAAHKRWRALTRRDRGAGQATRTALDWIGEKAGRQPFFLFLNYMDCHSPYHPRLPTRHRFVAPEDRTRADRIPQDPFAVMAGRLTFSARDIEVLKALYDGALLYLDAHVGALADALRRRGILDRTILIVTSDHGESFGEHGLLDHQYGLFEPLLAVPLIVRLPGGERGGEVDDRIVQLVDLFPTIADGLGDDIARDAGLAGRSLLRDDRREFAFAEYRVPNLRAFGRRFPDADVARYDVAIRAIRNETHKLIWWSDDRVALYDLASDPAEVKDLSPVRPDLARDLQDRIRRRLGGWTPADVRVAGDDGVDLIRDRLQQLGYL